MSSSASLFSQSPTGFIRETTALSSSLSLNRSDANAIPLPASAVNQVVQPLIKANMADILISGANLPLAKRLIQKIDISYIGCKPSLSVEGEDLIVQGASGLIGIWNKVSGSLIYTLQGRKDADWGFCRATTNYYLSYATHSGLSGEIIIWDKQSRSEQGRIPCGHSYIADEHRLWHFSIDWQQRDEKWVQEKALNAFELPSGKPLKSLPEPDVCTTSLQIVNQWLLYSIEAGIKIREKNTGDLFRMLPESAGCTIMLRGQQVLISGHKNGQIKVWHLEEGTSKLTISPPSGAQDVGVKTLHTEGHLLAALYTNQQLMVWNLLTGTMVYQLEQVEQSLLNKNHLIIRLLTGAIEVRELTTGKVMHCLDQSAVRGVCFKANGSYLASINTDNHMQVWHLKTGHLELETKVDSDVLIDDKNLIVPINSRIHIYDLSS